MGLKLAALVAALAVTPAGFLHAHQSPSGGFAEAGGSQGPLLTAWAALGLRASGADTGKALDYLQAHEAGPHRDDRRRARRAGRERARRQAGGAARPDPLRAACRRPHRPDRQLDDLGNPGAAAGAAARARGAVRFVLRQQARSGGWAWYLHGQPDSNDTAAAIEALRSAGVTGKPIRRGLAYLQRLQNRDGGFELTPGRGSDAQSTAWAVQAFVAAGRPAPQGSIAYLLRLRRPDGSFRYSKRYATTPVWVTAQVLPALARKPFPLG